MAAARGPIILLVDDEAEILKTLERSLMREFPDATIRLAPNAKEATTRLDEMSFDIIVSDYRMPGKDGVAFLQEVRARSPRTIRIMLTAYPEQQAAIRAINEAHLELFLAKPIAMDDFTRAIREVWNAKRAEDARAMAFARSLRRLQDEIQKEREARGEAVGPKPAARPFRGEL